MREDTLSDAGPCDKLFLVSCNTSISLLASYSMISLDIMTHFYACHVSSEWEMMAKLKSSNR